MKIQMEKRKDGIYAQWFEIEGLTANGRKTIFLIYAHQAKNYAQAIRFWKSKWGNTCKAFLLRNAEPYNLCLTLTC